jgi:DegV family protein with EDD domain
MFPKGRVNIVDTGQLSMGLGWLVVAAAKVAQANESVEKVIEIVMTLKAKTHVFAALDTFEFLRRSGRVSWAQAVVGALLRVKPLIQVREGEISPLERVRTSRRAMARLVELTENLGPLESLAILHSDWSDGADELRRRLAHLDPRDQLLTVDVTPVIGVHVGPRGLGVAAVSSARSNAVG